MQAGNPIVSPPEPIHVTNTTVVQVPPMDPQAVSDATVISDQSVIVNIVQPTLVEFTNSICNLPDIWRQTPPAWTYQLGDLRTLALSMTGAGLAFVSLAIFVRGLSMALGQGLQAGRVIFAALMSGSSIVWWELGINLNNAISNAIGAPDLCGSLIRPHIQLAHIEPDPAASMLQPVIVIVYAIVSIMLLFSLLFRLGMIDVMMVAGGFIMIAWADDRTEYLAQWYAKFSAGLVFGQILLVIGLRVAQSLSGLGGGGAAASLLAICVLLICRRLPSMLASNAAQSSGSRTGLVMATLVRRLITRVL